MSATRSLGSRSRNAGAQVVKPASSDQGPNHGGQGRRRGGEQGGVDKGGAGSGGASSASRPTPQQPKAQSPNQTISKIEARAELLTNLQCVSYRFVSFRFVSLWEGGREGGGVACLSVLQLLLSMLFGGGGSGGVLTRRE